MGNDTIFYNSDCAINSMKEDQLGRSYFSQHLGKTIYDYTGSDSLVIGLYGKWGTGKTSVANMALEKIKELSKDTDKKTIIVRFSPWSYSDKDNLTKQFFSTLKATFDSKNKKIKELDNNKKLKAELGKALCDYSDIFDLATVIPVVGGAVAPTLKVLAKIGGANLNKPIDLEEAKKALNKALKELNHKIVVLIDDIDRLTNSQIRDIFQLVKQVGDLPNIIYILAMDRDVVRRALAEIHNTDGNEYLEKIVQIPFEIPELKTSKLHEMFSAKLIKILKEQGHNVQLNQQDWDKIFLNSIAPYLRTLRDVNRVLNTFTFKFSILKEETAIEDLIAITTIEVLDPELYNWIVKNKRSLCSDQLHEPIATPESVNSYISNLKKEFESLGINSQRAINSLSSLFPRFGENVTIRSAIGSLTSLKGNMRIAHIDKFDLYFNLDFDSVKVPRSTLIDCIYSVDKQTLKETIAKINASNSAYYFLTELYELISYIPYERLPLLISVLIDAQNDFSNEYPTDLLAVSPSELAMQLTNDLFGMMETAEETYDIYMDCLKNANAGALCMLSRELYHMNTRKVNNEYSDVTFSNENITSLKSELVHQLDRFNIANDLLDKYGFKYVLLIWRDVNEKRAQDFINDIKNNEIMKLKFLCQFAEFYRNKDGILSWRYSPDNYSEYFIDSDLYASVQSLRSSDFHTFSEQELEKLAFFAMYFQQEYSVNTREQTIPIIDYWKTKNNHN